MSDSAWSFLGTVDEAGHIRPQDALRVRARLQRWKGKRVTVEVQKEWNPKTQAQLGYIFAEVIPGFAEFCGYEDQREFRNILYELCMPKRRRPSRLSEMPVEYTPRLSEASKEETSEFIDRIYRLAADHGYYIPPPKQ